VIKNSAMARALPPWQPATAAGASGVRVFVRKSGAPMTDGVPGFYTVDGFYKVLLPQLPLATRQVASESWVLGKDAQIDPTSPQVLSLQRDVIALYTDEYAKRWDALLDDLDVAPMRNLQDAVQELYILASPQSPLRDLLAGITRQLSLTQPPPAPPGVAGAVQGAANAATAAANTATTGLQGLFGSTTGAPPEPPGKAIETRYAALINFVGKGPGAPIDNVLKLLNDLQLQLSKLAGAPSAGTAAAIGGGDDPAALLQAEASRDPQPVGRWLQGLAVTGNQLRGGGALDQAKKAFNAPGGPASLCKQAVAGRYPFTPGSKTDIPLDDFARLFATGGLLDKYFADNLASFVDTSGPVWKTQAVAGVAPPVTPADLAQFQRASQIRDLFFAGGGNQPTVRFDITPMDTDAKQVTLDLDGLSVVYAHGPQRSTSVTWPGTNRMNSARLVFEPPPSSGPPVLQATGPWALFRLFGMGTLTQNGSADDYTLSFTAGDHHATFEIRAGSVLNPFAPGVLRDFKCPGL
jgi:type VI secretion system protein ImpL